MLIAVATREFSCFPSGTPGVAPLVGESTLSPESADGRVDANMREDPEIFSGSMRRLWAMHLNAPVNC